MLLRTAHVTKELSPFLADLLGFRLVMTDREDKTVLPPPAYIFAPFYVDQDTCGQGYDNSLTERFALVEDHDGLFNALTVATDKLYQCGAKIEVESKNLDEAAAAIARVERVLAARKADLTFRDVVAAEGRNEAVRIIREQRSSTDAAAGEKIRLIEQQQSRMDASANKERSQEIRDFFIDRLAKFSEQLDVRLDDVRRQRMSSMVLGRGSEGPRGLIAYYYAFLHTANAHSSSAFCPIVIDAPNQQGQDDVHMPRIMQFIVDQRPERSQVIVASEKLFDLSPDSVDVVEVGKAKNQVLSEEHYAAVWFGPTSANFSECLMHNRKRRLAPQWRSIGMIVAPLKTDEEIR